MKKIISLAVAFIAFSTFSWAQELKIIQQDSTKILNGDTLIVYGDSINEMNVNLDIINSGFSDDDSVFVRRDSLSLPMPFNSDNEFCWVLCYDSTAGNISQYPQVIPRGDTAGGVNGGASLFQGHYWPYGHMAAAYIRYTFHNRGNLPSDSSWVVVEYLPVPTAGVQNISAKDIGFSAPYPSPANTTVGFNYSLNRNTQAATMKIFNMIGECIQTLPLNASKNKAAINVQTMPSGIYICEIEASGCQPAYQKLVVSH